MDSMGSLLTDRRVLYSRLQKVGFPSSLFCGVEDKHKLLLQGLYHWMRGFYMDSIASLLKDEHFSPTKNTWSFC